MDSPTLIAKAIAIDQQDTGGQNYEELKRQYDIALSEEKRTSGNTKPLSAEAAKTVGNVQSGLNAITTVEQELKSNPNVMYQSAIPGSPGARVFTTARNEILDVLSRMRTGAAISETEESFYRDQLPNILDDQRTVDYKLNLFKNLFTRINDEVTSSGEQQ